MADVTIVTYKCIVIYKCGHSGRFWHNSRRSARDIVQQASQMWCPDCKGTPAPQPTRSIKAGDILRMNVPHTQDYCVSIVRLNDLSAYYINEFGRMDTAQIYHFTFRELWEMNGRVVPPEEDEQP